MGEKYAHDAMEYDFALRMATAIDDLRSSHSFFVMQKAFGEIEWSRVEEILTGIITKCDCQKCEDIKKEVIRRFT